MTSLPELFTKRLKLRAVYKLDSPNSCQRSLLKFLSYEVLNVRVQDFISGPRSHENCFLKEISRPKMRRKKIIKKNKIFKETNRKKSKKYRAMKEVKSKVELQLK